VRRGGLSRRQVLQGGGIAVMGAGGLTLADIAGCAPNTGFPASKGQGRMDLKVQAYRGQPVLTWWEGQVIKGYGERGSSAGSGPASTWGRARPSGSSTTSPRWTRPR
jgi:hypothetical protein